MAGSKDAEVLFYKHDDPDYYAEGDQDRRDYLGTIISYDDIKTLSKYLPYELIEQLLDRMDRWGDEVSSIFQEG